MHQSESGLAFLKSLESRKLFAYWDVDGWAIGYGQHGAEIKQGTVWTQGQADQAIEQTVLELEARMAPMITADVSQNQWDALVSFTYNEGVGHLHGSHLLVKLNAWDTRGAANEFGKWIYAGGRVRGALVARRAAEQRLFLTPDGVAPSANPVIA